MSSRAQTAIVKFTGDLISFVLENQKIKWKLDLPSVKSFKSIFKPEFGEAVLVCQKFSKEFFNRIVDKCPIDFLNHEDDDDFVAFIGTFMDSNFTSEGIYLLHVLKAFAFIAYLGVYCYKNGFEDCVSMCAISMEVTYMEHLDKTFETVGGYTALFRFAEQYLEYHNKNQTEAGSSSDSSQKSEKSDSFMLKQN